MRRVVWGFALAVILVAWLALSLDGETARFFRDPQQATSYQLQVESQRHDALMERKAARVATLSLVVMWAAYALVGAIIAGLLYTLFRGIVLSIADASMSRHQRARYAGPRIVERERIVYVERIPQDDTVWAEWREVDTGRRLTGRNEIVRVK
jgi:hypothetical protein